MRVSFTQSKHGFTPWAVALIAVAWALAPALAGPPAKTSITPDEVNAAQQKWCDGLLEIGGAYRQGGDHYKAVASRFTDNLYDYKEGRVFFKPTLAFGEHTFRPTREGALSYFIKGIIPSDEGFALKHWVKCGYTNNAGGSGIQIHGDIAITMGNVSLTNNEGKVTTVDKTFVFRKCSDGKLRLCVHHSSLHDPGK